MIKKGKKKYGLVIILLNIIILAVVVYLIYQRMADEQSKICRGVDIIFFPGGNPEGTFAAVVYNGAKEAEKNLGANVEYKWSGWNATKMIEQFQESIDENPDAICIMGHPGEEEMMPLINEALRRGIIVTSQNVEVGNLVEDHFYVSKGFGYIGQDTYNSGVLLAKGSVREFSLGQGEEAIVFGLLSQAGRGVRAQGCIDGLNNSGLIVHYIEIPPAVNLKPYSDDAVLFFNESINKFPNVKLIITDKGELTSASTSIMKKLGKRAGEINIAGFDLSPDTLEGLKSGYVGLVHDQQPYLQGYLPILQVCLTKKYGFSGLNIDTGIGLVTNETVKDIENLVEKKIR